MKRMLLIVLLTVFSFNISEIFAQSDIEIFGFYQVRVSKEVGSLKVSGIVPTQIGPINMTFRDEKLDHLSPYVQQLDLMLRKEFSSNVSTFINFEIINNFSTENNWGAFNLEELWLNYEYASNQSIKGGLLIPRFNNLNEIKNRMPLLPYILRPTMYEPSLRSILDPSDFLPGRAFVQLEGKFYSNDFEFNYAAYAGPAENSYIVSSGNVGYSTPGTDTTNFKLFGGRVGINYRDLRLGVSTSFDKDNQQATFKEDISRIRLGFDLGFSIYGFSLDGEYIKVMLDPKKTDLNLDKLAYFATLQYDITNQIFAYGTYSYLEDKADDILPNGLVNTIFGGGYKASDNVVLKLQYINYKLNGNLPISISPAIPPINADIDLNFSSYSLALSVIF